MGGNPASTAARSTHSSSSFSSHMMRHKLALRRHDGRRRHERPARTPPRVARGLGTQQALMRLAPLLEAVGIEQILVARPPGAGVDVRRETPRTDSGAADTERPRPLRSPVGLESNARAHPNRRLRCPYRGDRAREPGPSDRRPQPLVPRGGGRRRSARTFARPRTPARPPQGRRAGTPKAVRGHESDVHRRGERLDPACAAGVDVGERVECDQERNASCGAGV
jgi:hypothetical protein